jgi:hypothetical protein
MLQGYWSDEWQIAYIDTYIKPDEETVDARSKQLTKMGRWQTKLIRTLWENMTALWQIQNDKQHGQDKETRKAACHEVLTNKLQVLYTNRDQYPSGVWNHLLKPPFAEHCRDTASRLEVWLSAYCVTFKAVHIQVTWLMRQPQAT